MEPHYWIQIIFSLLFCLHKTSGNNSLSKGRTPLHVTSVGDIVESLLLGRLREEAANPPTERSWVLEGTDSKTRHHLHRILASDDSLYTPHTSRMEGELQEKKIHKNLKLKSRLLGSLEQIFDEDTMVGGSDLKPDIRYGTAMGIYETARAGKSDEELSKESSGFHDTSEKKRVRKASRRRMAQSSVSSYQSANAISRPKAGDSPKRVGLIPKVFLFQKGTHGELNLPNQGKMKLSRVFDRQHSPGTSPKRDRLMPRKGLSERRIGELHPPHDGFIELRGDFNVREGESRTSSSRYKRSMANINTVEDVAQRRRYAENRVLQDMKIILLRLRIQAMKQELRKKIQAAKLQLLQEQQLRQSQQQQQQQQQQFSQQQQQQLASSSPSPPSTAANQVATGAQETDLSPVAMVTPDMPAPQPTEFQRRDWRTFSDDEKEDMVHKMTDEQLLQVLRQLEKARNQPAETVTLDIADTCCIVG